MSQADGSNNHNVVGLQGVCKSFETGVGAVSVLKGVSLRIGDGEFVGVVGPSGSGKSTMINIIAGIDRPTDGEVWVAGRRLNDMGEGELARFRGRNVGVIFQFFQLIPTLTVLDNVMLPMDFCNTFPVRQRRERAMELLELVQVPEIAHKLPSQASGGQQQRAAIARALANDPRLIVADEPTGNLDTASAQLVFALFGDLVARGRTVVMVTHDRELARMIPRVEEVRDGHLAAA